MALYNTLRGNLSQTALRNYNFLTGKFYRCPQFQKQGQKTTPGTTFPTLLEKRSLQTSTEKMQETGPTAFRPYPRNKDLIHPVAYTLPNNRGFIALVIRFL